MRVPVMGADRYIGLEFVFELVRRGHEVTVTNSPRHRRPKRRAACTATIR